MSLEITETIKNRTDLFNIKRFKYGKLKADNVVKTIDARNLNNSELEFLKSKWKNSEIIFEKTRIIDSLKWIDDLLLKDAAEQSKSFGRSSALSGFTWSIPLTLNLNSKSDVANVQKNTKFFDLYYAHSDFLFVPNVSPIKFIEGRDKKFHKTIILDWKKYVEYVDSVFDIFNYKNNKPIFVPLSPKFGIDDVTKIIEYYVKKEYFNFWIDFNGSYVKENCISMARQISRILDDAKRFDDALIYSTNIKREIISHPLDKETPASDIMAPLIGSNIVGSDREPRKPMPKSEVPVKPKYTKEQLFSHKNRLFIPDTYFYVKQSFNPSSIKNPVANNLSLHNEILNQCKEFAGKGIQPYVSNKKMFKTHPRASFLLARIFSTKRQYSLKKWF